MKSLKNPFSSYELTPFGEVFKKDIEDAIGIKFKNNNELLFFIMNQIVTASPEMTENWQDVFVDAFKHKSNTSERNDPKLDDLIDTLADYTVLVEIEAQPGYLKHMKPEAVAELVEKGYLTTNLNLTEKAKKLLYDVPHKGNPRVAYKKLTQEQKRRASLKIRKLIREGYPQKQAVAVGLKMSAERKIGKRGGRK